MENVDKNRKFEWFANGNAPELYPAELLMGNFIFENRSTKEIPKLKPFATEWGKQDYIIVLDGKKYPAPAAISIVWLSLAEQKYYTVIADLPQEQMAAMLAEENEKTKTPKYDHIIAGMAPYGKLAIWLSGNGITTEVAWLQGEEIEFESNKTPPKELPNPLLFEQYMQKFNYRITLKFDDAAQFEGIELYYFNGELNTLNNGEHASNAMRAKPRKIVINWREGKKQYGAYFWTNEEKIIETFANIFGNDAEKEGELVIETDASNKQFKFFLKNNENSIEIPLEDMQYIVFKNKYEFFKSKNYNKPQGGWKD